MEIEKLALSNQETVIRELAASIYLTSVGGKNFISFVDALKAAKYIITHPIILPGRLGVGQDEALNHFHNTGEATSEPNKSKWQERMEEIQEAQRNLQKTGQVITK